MRIIGPRPVERNGLRGFVTTFEFGNTHSQAPEHKSAGHAPRNEGGYGANAGGNHVDRSTERAGHAGQPFDALTGQFESRIKIVERNTSGPDAKRASNSHSQASPLKPADSAGSVPPPADPATNHASRNGEG